jgi:P27 family predicted phage terminase small subunit
MRGRKPTPTYLKLLKGNPGRRPIVEDGIDPPVSEKVPPPPQFLEGYAADEWWKMATELYRMRLLTVVDETALASYCLSYARWRDAEELLSLHKANDPRMRGLLVRGKNTTIENPLIGIARRASQEMLRVASEFGFTPAARARIAAGIVSAPQSSKFGDLLAQ